MTDKTIPEVSTFRALVQGMYISTKLEGSLRFMAKRGKKQYYKNTT
jgi:hypothetical protein